MRETEQESQINEIRISGWLMEDVVQLPIRDGSTILKTRLVTRDPVHFIQRMRFDVFVWCRDMPDELINEMLSLYANEEVVVTGQLILREHLYQTYLEILCRNPAHGIKSRRQGTPHC